MFDKNKEILYLHMNHIYGQILTNNKCFYYLMTIYNIMDDD